MRATGGRSAKCAGAQQAAGDGAAAALLGGRQAATPGQGDFDARERVAASPSRRRGSDRGTQQRVTGLFNTSQRGFDACACG